jgi:hypothetical protein
VIAQLLTGTWQDLIEEVGNCTGSKVYQMWLIQMGWVVCFNPAADCAIVYLLNFSVAHHARSTGARLHMPSFDCSNSYL